MFCASSKPACLSRLQGLDMVFANGKRGTGPRGNSAPVIYLPSASSGLRRDAVVIQQPDTLTSGSESHSESWLLSLIHGPLFSTELGEEPPRRGCASQACCWVARTQSFCLMGVCQIAVTVSGQEKRIFSCRLAGRMGAHY